MAKKNPIENLKISNEFTNLVGNNLKSKFLSLLKSRTNNEKYSRDYKDDNGKWIYGHPKSWLEDLGGISLRQFRNLTQELQKEEFIKIKKGEKKNRTNHFQISSGCQYKTVQPIEKSHSVITCTIKKDNGFYLKENIQLAAIIGSKEAQLVNRIQYWQTKGGTYHEGHNYVYFTITALANQLTVSESTIERAISKLSNMGLLLKKKLHKDRGNRTNYFAVNEQKMAELLIPSTLALLDNTQSPQPIENTHSVITCTINANGALLTESIVQFCGNVYKEENRTNKDNKSNKSEDFQNSVLGEDSSLSIPNSLTPTTNETTLVSTENGLLREEGFNSWTSSSPLLHKEPDAIQNVRPSILNGIGNTTDSVEEEFWHKDFDESLKTLGSFTEAVQEVDPRDKPKTTTAQDMLAIWNETLGEKAKAVMSKTLAPLLVSAYSVKFENSLMKWERYCKLIATSAYIMSDKFSLLLSWALKFETIDRLLNAGELGVKPGEVYIYVENNFSQNYTPAVEAPTMTKPSRLQYSLSIESSDEHKNIKAIRRNLLDICPRNYDVLHNKPITQELGLGGDIIITVDDPKQKEEILKLFQIYESFIDYQDILRKFGGSMPIVVVKDADASSGNEVVTNDVSILADSMSNNAKNNENDLPKRRNPILVVQEQWQQEKQKAKLSKPVQPLRIIKSIENEERPLQQPIRLLGQDVSRLSQPLYGKSRIVDSFPNELPLEGELLHLMSASSARIGSAHLYSPTLGELGKSKASIPPLPICGAVIDLNAPSLFWINPEPWSAKLYNTKT